MGFMRTPWERLPTIRPERLFCNRASEQHLHLGVALPAQQIDGDRGVVAPEHEVELAFADVQVPHRQPFDELRQGGAAQDYGARRGVDLEAWAGLDEREGGARGPSLWRAGHRVQRRRLPAHASEAAEEL